MISSASPSIFQRIGQQVFANGGLALGNNPVVLAAANVNGVIIRTAYLVSIAGNIVDLRNGGFGILFGATNGGLAFYQGTGILFPAGQPVNIFTSSGAGGQAYLTYDIL